MTTDLKSMKVEELENVLIRNGFVRCDIPACNCGSWHARYGLRERFDEIKDALAEAGHPLCNENGHIALEALKALITERDELARRLEKAQQQIVAQGLAENLLKRLIGRIMENADVSLPDATDIELQLVRQLSTVAEAKAEALEEARAGIDTIDDGEQPAYRHCQEFLGEKAAEYRAKAGRKE